MGSAGGVYMCVFRLILPPSRRTISATESKSMILAVQEPGLTELMWRNQTETDPELCSSLSRCGVVDPGQSLENKTLFPSSSDRKYLLISFRKSTPPQNRQLNILIGNSKQQVVDFVGELTFEN